jgi:hypothetical protein
VPAIRNVLQWSRVVDVITTGALPLAVGQCPGCCLLPMEK